MRYGCIRHWFFVCRGVLYPVAMESALKFKEGTYRQAEGVAAGSFKHGPYIANTTRISYHCITSIRCWQQSLCFDFGDGKRDRSTWRKGYRVGSFEQA
jgi:hypothetical protein